MKVQPEFFMTKSINLSPVSYKKWIQLVFDHPVPQQDENGLPKINERWHYQDQMEFHLSNPTRFIEHMARLCREFNGVAENYTLEQIDQGIWFVLSGQIEIGTALADEDIALDKRVDCVRAMFTVFADFVAPSQVEVMENCFDMWWDLICTSYWGAHRWRIRGDEIMEQMQREDEEADIQLSAEEKERRTQMVRILSQLEPGEDANEVLQRQGFSFDDFPSDDDPKISTEMEIEFEDLTPTEHQVMDAMFEILTKILYLDDQRCESYALHGLNHLPHPQRSATVQKFIDSRAHEWDEQTLGWVENCRDGKAM